MNRNWLVPALGAVLGVSCGTPTDTTVTQLNLDRPIDIAFACYGNMRVTNGGQATKDQPIIDTAQPAAACEAWSPKIAPVELQPASGQETIDTSVVNAPSWYGFILQSASGTVALAKWAAKPSFDPAGLTEVAGGDVSVLDGDRLTPGKNAISIGEEPVAIATDTSGCYEVTANAGSCDLSVLDIKSAIDHAAGDPTAKVRVDRRGVTNRTGAPILAKPAVMVAQPNTTVLGKVCPTVGSSMDPAPAGVMYIAYPSCHLVAGVDMSDGMAGKIIAGIKYDTDVPHLLNDAELDTLTCPDECPNAMGTLGNGPIDQKKPRPVTLDLKLDTRMNTNRLAIGTDNKASITVVDLDPITSLPMAAAPAQFALEDKTSTLGVTSVAISPQITMGGTMGNNDTDQTTALQGQYVYAVATDGTVRVVDILTVNKECDTQVDTRFVRHPETGVAYSLAKLQCFPVGDSMNPRRRVGARGPGIELIGDAVPTSVAILHGLDAPLTKSTTNSSGVTETTELTPDRSTLIGTFAIVTASNGRTFVVNIDDDHAPDAFNSRDPLTTTPTLVMAHQLRDSLDVRGAIAESRSTSEDGTVESTPSCNAVDPDASLGGASAGGPRTTSAPVVNATGGPVHTTKLAELPTLRQIKCEPTVDAPSGAAISELQFGAPPSTRDQVFPDLRSLTSDEIWSLTWEGPLSQDSPGTAVDGPAVRTAKMVVDGAGMHLLDQARPFCTMGVERYDIVNFRGCNPMNGDGDCPSGYQCFVHPDSKIAIGSCMLKNEASRLATACRDFLISARHYTVKLAQSGELLLLPRKHELRTTPLDGCTSDAQCQELANYAVQNGSPNLVDLGPDGKDKDVDPHTWACMTDDARAPINPDPMKNQRCVQTCAYHPDPKDRDKDCDVNLICQGATPSSPGICMEGVTPPQACVNGPQRFDVRASEAFTVIGTRSGYIHPIVDQSMIAGGTDHTCVADPAASPIQRGRIPLKAPACDPSADPITGQLPISTGGFEANPCSWITVPQIELKPVFPDPTSCTRGEDMLGPRDAPAIQFRNPGMRLTLVDPYYPGDQMCVRDGKGVTVDGQPQVHIPLVFPGYSINFEQKAGFTPFTLPSINPVFPVKVVRGPSDSIWVIDNGDFLSTTLDPSTRGQVFRVESTQLQVINVLK